MTLWDMHRARIADERIADTYASDGLTATYFLHGWISWEEAQYRWARVAKHRAVAWAERRAI